MLRYEVTVTVREELRVRFEEYFTTRHIPEILATGCFIDIRFDKSDTGVYRTVYHAAARADLERYLQQHAAHFRADFAQHFPDGVTPSPGELDRLGDVGASLMSTTFRGAFTIKYAVPDLAAAKAFYTDVTGVAPYFDEPFYVGFNINGYELGLDPDLSITPSGPGGTVAYWGVAEIGAAFAQLLQSGAKEIEAPHEVGGGIKVATLADPWGNLIGIIENPRFWHHP